MVQQSAKPAGGRRAILNADLGLVNVFSRAAASPTRRPRDLQPTPRHAHTTNRTVTGTLFAIGLPGRAARAVRSRREQEGPIPAQSFGI